LLEVALVAEAAAESAEAAALTALSPAEAL
jgi:hypothetical protein